MITTKRILCVVVPLAVLNGSLAFVVRGHFFPCLLAAGIALLGAGTIIFALLTWLLSMVFSEPTGPRFAKRLLFVGIIASSLGSTIPLGGWIQEHDVATAKQYCENLIPLLEEFRQQHGMYPKKIEDLGNNFSPPWLLDCHADFYRRRDSGYSFHVHDHTLLFGEYRFTSDGQRWEIYD